MIFQEVVHSIKTGEADCDEQSVSEEKDRMDIHKNARLSFRSREALVKMVIEAKATRHSAAAAFRVSPKTAAKWVYRYQARGTDGLVDLSSRPHRSPRQTPSALLERVLSLRRGHMPAYQIALRCGLSPARSAASCAAPISAAGAEAAGNETAH